MYNLIVAGNTEFFDQGFFTLEKTRCVNEYTEDAIIEKVGDFSDPSIHKLKSIPSIFAYESVNEKNPFFGRITKVGKRGGNEIYVEFERYHIHPFLRDRDLLEMAPRLDIGKWELNRTHWAVKDVDLFDLLIESDVELPAWARQRKPAIDLSTHMFDVGLSFPGESRTLVEKIVTGLERELGPNSYFYDFNYKPQLAVSNAHHLLQEIYGRRSKLIVVFIGSDYAAKTWCKLEWRSIEQIITSADPNKVMFIRTDDGDVPGVLPTDGYMDSRIEDVETLIEAIITRAEIATR